MKKRSKYALIGGGIIAAMALAAYVGTRESFQTKIANSILADNFAGAKLEGVQITFGSFRISKLYIPLNETTRINLESASGDFSVFALLTKNIELSNVRVKDLGVAITDAPEQSAAPTATPQPAPAQPAQDSTSAPSAPIAKAETLPAQKSSALPKWNVSIKSLDANTTVELPDSSKIESTLVLKSFIAENTLFIKSMDFDLKNKIMMKGLDDENIELLATVAPSNKAKSVKLAIDRGGKKLLQVSGKIDADYRQVETQMQIIAETSDVANILKGAPDFKIHAFAETNFDTNLDRLKTKISLKADTKNLDSFAAEIQKNPNYKALAKYADFIKPFTEISASLEISAELADKKLSIANSDILVSANRNQILRVKNASAFKLDPQSISEIPDGELLEIQIPSLPSSIVNAFIGGVQLDSAPISAKFKLSKFGDKFSFTSVQPLRIPYLKVAKDGRMLVSKISPTIEIDADYDANRANASIKILTNPAEGKNLSCALNLAAANTEDASLSIAIEGDPAPFAGDVKLPEPLRISLGANASLAKKIANLESLSLKISGEKSGELLKLSQLSKISYDFEKSEPIFSGKIFEAESKDVPFAIFKPFAAGADAKTFSLKLAANAEKDGLVNAAIEAKFADFSFVKDNAYVLKGLGISTSANIAADIAKKNFSLKSESIEITQGGIALILARLSASGSFAEKFNLTDAKLNASGSLPKILSQPALEKFANASNGAFEAEAAFIGDNASLNAKLFNVSPKTYPETTGSFTLSAIAKLKDFSPQNVSANLFNVNTKGKTDIALEASIADDINIKLKSQKIVCDDFEILAKAFTNPIFKDGAMRAESPDDIGKKRILRPAFPGETTPVAQTQIPAATQTLQTPATQTQKDKIAVWDFGKKLSLAADIAEVARMDETIAKNISAEFSLSPSEANLAKLVGEIYGAKILADAKILFTAQSVYDLNGKASLKGLQIDRFMEPNNSGEKMFVGKFDIDAKVFGQSESAESLANKAKGEFSMISNGGKMHILDKASNTGRAVEIGSSLLKIGGQVLGKKVKELGAIGDITSMLSEMNYSHIHVYAERDNALDIVIKDAEVRADHIMLKTKGVLKHDSRIPFAAQTIHFPVELYAKDGEVASLFEKIGLRGTAKLDGYTQSATFTISGPLENPDNNLLDVISNAALNRVGVNSENSAPTNSNSLKGAIGNLLKNKLER